MSHTILNLNYKATTTPAGLYEANYRRLDRLIPELRALPLNKTIDLPTSKLSIGILQQYKYTSVLALKQSLLTTNEQFSFINMELRMCHDARLLEVIGYQGKNPVQSAVKYPNKHMLQLDEKKQLNLLLKDILEHAIKTKSYSEGNSSLHCH